MGVSNLSVTIKIEISVVTCATSMDPSEVMTYAGLYEIRENAS